MVEVIEEYGKLIAETVGAALVLGVLGNVIYLVAEHGAEIINLLT